MTFNNNIPDKIYDMNRSTILFYVFFFLLLLIIIIIIVIFKSASVWMLVVRCLAICVDKIFFSLRFNKYNIQSSAFFLTVFLLYLVVTVIKKQ